MFTHSHANTPLGQSKRAYYLSYFVNLDIFAGLIGLICRFFCAIASLFIPSRIKKRELVSSRAAIAAISM